MASGNVAPLMNASGDAELALLLRDDPKSRVDDAHALDDAIAQSLGARLPEADHKKLTQLLEDWQRGRADEMIVSLARAPARGAVLRTKVADKEALVRALRGLGDVLKVQAIKDPLRIKDVVARTADVPEYGKVDEIVAELLPGKPDPRRDPRRGGDPGKKPEPPKTYGLAWTVKDDVAVVALGDDSAKVLASLGKQERKLGDDRIISVPLEAVGDGVSFATVIQPFKLDPARLGKEPAPLVITWGRRDKAALLRAWVASPVVKELVRRELFGP
jgi:hypothetical protein